MEIEIFDRSKNKSDPDKSEKTTHNSPVLRVFMDQQRPLKFFISRFIRRPQDIDDIAQETFVRAFAAEEKNEIQHPKAYIYRIARNLALEVLSRKSTQLTSFIEDSCDPNLLSSGEDVEGSAMVMERFDRVKEAIAEMPPQCQRVFIMHKVYGFKYGEISQQLGISVSTVEKHIMAGLKKCRQYVKNSENIKNVLDISAIKPNVRKHSEE